MDEHLAQITAEKESAINVLRVLWLFIGLSFMLALGALFIRLVRRSVQRRVRDGENKRVAPAPRLDAWDESARRMSVPDRPAGRDDTEGDGEGA